MKDETEIVIGLGRRKYVNDIINKSKRCAKCGERLGKFLVMMCKCAQKDGILFHKTCFLETWTEFLVHIRETEVYNHCIEKEDADRIRCPKCNVIYKIPGHFNKYKKKDKDMARWKYYFYLVDRRLDLFSTIFLVASLCVSFTFFTHPLLKICTICFLYILKVCACTREFSRDSATYDLRCIDYTFPFDPYVCPARFIQNYVHNRLDYIMNQCKNMMIILFEWMVVAIFAPVGVVTIFNALHFFYVDGKMVLFVWMIILLVSTVYLSRKTGVEISDKNKAMYCYIDYFKDRKFEPHYGPYDLLMDTINFSLQKKLRCLFSWDHKDRLYIAWNSFDSICKT